MNRIESSITLGLLLTALVAGEAAAQWNITQFGDRPNRIYTVAGLDPAVIGTIGYARTFDLIEMPFQFTTEVGIQAIGTNARDFRSRIGVQGALLHWRSLYVSGSATFIARGTENSVYRGFNFGSDFTATIGTYRRRWFAAGDFGFDKAIITHVTHSDWYRENFFPDAKDAWYLDTGGTYHYGAQGGLTLGRTEVVGRFGWQRTERFRTLTPPVYVGIGLGFRY